jgi:hypothetical protein
MQLNSALPKITFERSDIFGNKFSRKRSGKDCIVTNILSALTLEGKIKNTNIDNSLTKEDLWYYIYYLWHHNKNHYILREMSDEKHNYNASASYFVSTILNTLFQSSYISKEDLQFLLQTPEAITIEHLSTFINHIITVSGQNVAVDEHVLQIPAISNIIRLTMENLRAKQDQHDRAFDELQASMQDIRDTSIKNRRMKVRFEKVTNEDNTTPLYSEEKEGQPTREVTVRLVTGENNSQSST